MKPPTARQRLRAPLHWDLSITGPAVWDRVAALGIPVKVVRGLSRRARGKCAFRDTVLGVKVDHAFHARAIGEERGPFTLTLWKPPGQDGNQSIEQV